MLESSGEPLIQCMMPNVTYGSVCPTVAQPWTDKKSESVSLKHTHTLAFEDHTNTYTL